LVFLNKVVESTAEKVRDVDQNPEKQNCFRNTFTEGKKKVLGKKGRGEDTGAGQNSHAEKTFFFLTVGEVMLNSCRGVAGTKRLEEKGGDGTPHRVSNGVLSKRRIAGWGLTRK